MMAGMILPSELCGERTLGLLATPIDYADKLKIAGDDVEAVDACGGAVLRTLIERHARHRQRRVELSLPRDEAVAEKMHALVRHLHPAHLVLARGSKRYDDPVPGEILLQAQRVPSVEEASHLAEALFARGGAPDGARRFAAKHLPELVTNSLEHAQDPAMLPVACAVHNPGEGLQLTVIDCGRRRPPHDEKTLKTAVLDSPASATLRTLVDHAGHHSLDLQLSLVSGTGKLYWREGRWVAEKAEPMPGFAAVMGISA